MKELKEKKDDYFEQLSDIHTLSKGESSSESDNDDVDSDYQSEILSIIDDKNDENLEDELEHQYYNHGTPSEINSESIDASLEDSFTFSQQPQNPSVEDHKWGFQVECTSQVLKKLRHKKTPLYFRKAVCKAIDDLACGRHQIPIKTIKTAHKLYQRKILQNRVTIL